MPVDGKLLEILCCPVSKTPLTRVSAEQLRTLNSAIESGAVAYIGGEPVENPLVEALVTEDLKVIYPVENDIPVLLSEKGIGTTQLASF